MKINNKSKKIIYIAITGIALAVALILIFTSNKTTGNAPVISQDWLSDNCECIAHNRPMCPSGFYLSGSFCTSNENHSLITSRILGCSEYNCSGEINVFNNQTGEWEIKK